jgi:hypothetical protein
MIEFKEWPKTPRLNRDMIVTEKIDGTNAAVIVLPTEDECAPGELTHNDFGVYVETTLGKFIVAAQSRKRIISPGKQTDNAGFAAWVRANAADLAEVLGEGYHYGEWWGAQAARTALKPGEQKLSLFNVNRYAGAELERVPGLELVPVLYEGPFSQDRIQMIVEELRERGSQAHPGVPAEGVIVFHKAAGHVYKVLCENDELPKGIVPYIERQAAQGL